MEIITTLEAPQYRAAFTAHMRRRERETGGIGRSVLSSHGSGGEVRRSAGSCLMPVYAQCTRHAKKVVVYGRAELC